LDPDTAHDPCATVGSGRLEIEAEVEVGGGSTTSPLANASGSLISLPLATIWVSHL